MPGCVTGINAGSKPRRCSTTSLFMPGLKRAERRLMLPMKSTDPDVPNRSHSKGGCAATEHAHFFEILVERVGCPQKLVGIF